MSKKLSDQENFWSGSFGDEYILRNREKELLAANTALLAKILGRTANVKSLMEFGANIGMNLHAIRRLLPSVSLGAVEINSKAVSELEKFSDIQVSQGSILEIEASAIWDMVLIKGVLIHIAPESLNEVYDKLYESSKRYIVLVEYYNPSPVELDYRGHSAKLFKRDFAGEMLDKYTDLKLVDYGFVYHRDTDFPQDDLNWFLLEKQ